MEIYISIERMRYEKDPHVSDYCDGCLGQPDVAGMSHVATTCSSGVACATANPCSRLIVAAIKVV